MTVDVPLPCTAPCITRCIRRFPAQSLPLHVPCIQVYRQEWGVPKYPLTDYVAAASASAANVMLPFKPPYKDHVHEVVM